MVHGRKKVIMESVLSAFTMIYEPLAMNLLKPYQLHLYGFYSGEIGYF